MQFVLSKEELDELVPRKDWEKYHRMLCDLRTKYLEETKRPCIEKGQYCYCADCPIEEECTNEYKAFPNGI